MTSSGGGRAADRPPRIVADPAVRSGKPVFRGTRIAVADVREYFASGTTDEEILADFPDLTADDLRAVRAYGGG